MVVLPADHLIGREAVFRSRAPCGGRRDRPGELRRSTPRSSRSASRPIDRRPSTATSCPPRAAARTSSGLRAYPLERFEEKPHARIGPIDLARACRASPGTPGCSCGSAGRSGPPWRLRRPTSSARSTRRPRRRPAGRGLRHALRIDLDRLRRHGAGGRAGRVVMGAMDVGWSDLGSWTALLAALGGVGDGRVVQAWRGGRGRARRPRRRAGRRAARPGRRSPRYPRRDAGRPAGRRSSRSRQSSMQLLDRVAATGGLIVTNIAEAPAPTKIVFGTDGWRAKIADEYTFENVRRCADGVARYVVERGEQAKGVVIAYDRRFASEHFAAAAAEVLLAHDIPVAYRQPRGPDPDVELRGRRARRRRPGSSSPPATTRGPTTGSRSRPRPGRPPDRRSWR